MSDEYNYNQQQTYQQQQSYQQAQGSYGQGGYNQYAPPPPPPMNYGMVNQPVKGGGWASLLRVTCWILGILMWLGGIGVFMQAYDRAQEASNSYWYSDSSSAIMGAGIASLFVCVLFGLIIVAAGNLAANHYKLSQQIAANTNYLINQSLQNRQ